MTPSTSRPFAQYCKVSMSGIEMNPGSTSMIAWPNANGANGSPARDTRNATSSARNIARPPTRRPVRVRESMRRMYGTIRRVVSTSR